jgi:hypothetical protein
VAQATKPVVTRINLRMEPMVARLLDRYIEGQNRALAPAKVEKNALINRAIVAYITAHGHGQDREERAS